MTRGPSIAARPSGGAAPLRLDRRERLAEIADLIVAKHRAAAKQIPGGSKRLPPFGRRLLDVRRRGLVPATGQVAIGVDSWRLVNTKREDAIVLPRGEHAASFDWRFVAGLPVIIVARIESYERAEVLGDQVVGAGSAGCCILLVTNDPGNVLLVLRQSHREEVRHAA